MPMRLEIITAERQVYADDVDSLQAPGIEGYLGILPHHAPLMTMLRPGEMVIRKGGQEEYLAITGGFLEVLNNKVTILADACERSEEIDEERARKAMERARERLSMRGADVDLERALATLQRAEARLKIVQRRKAGMGRTQPPRPG